MSLDKHLLDQQIVAKVQRYFEVEVQVNEAKTKVLAANRDHRCTASKAFECTRRLKIGIDWCPQCRLRQPYHNELKKLSGYEKVALKDLRELNNKRERLFPSKKEKV